MADGVTLNAGSGGAVIATDDDGTAHHQYVKLEAEVKNNIFETVTTPISDSGTSTVKSTNFCDSAGTGCSVTGSPSFTSAGTDFTLQSGSNCRDAGADLSATLTTDYIGTSRPQNGTFDIGAYEYIVSAGGGDGGMSQAPAWDTPRRSHLWRR